MALAFLRGLVARGLSGVQLVISDAHRGLVETIAATLRSQRPPTVETTVTRPITDLADLRSIRRQPILDGLISQYHRAA
jgi:transposase-like protein